MVTKINKTVLIVEDETAMLKIARDVLEFNGFSTLVANDGQEGVEVALSKHPDLILLDLLLPKINGMEALEQIRQDAWGAKVPVIILTNLSADDEKLVQAMVNGRPVCYLIKSDWKIPDIAKKIKEILKV